MFRQHKSVNQCGRGRRRARSRTKTRKRIKTHKKRVVKRSTKQRRQRGKRLRRGMTHPLLKSRKRKGTSSVLNSLIKGVIKAQFPKHFKK